MTAEQQHYSDFIFSLNRDALIEETIHMIMLSAHDSAFGTEYHWKRRICHQEWILRDGNDDQYYEVLDEAVRRQLNNGDKDN